MKKLVRKASDLSLYTALMYGLQVKGVFAQTGTEDDICEGINLADPDAEGGECQRGAEFGDLFERIVDFLLLIVGAISVIMLIVGGIRYVVSGGDQQAITDAKNTILYALIGLIIAALAFVIVNFVLGQVVAPTT